jgi:hypothetical protein
VHRHQSSVCAQQSYTAHTKQKGTPNPTHEGRETRVLQTFLCMMQSSSNRVSTLVTECRQHTDLGVRPLCQSSCRCVRMLPCKWCQAQRFATDYTIAPACRTACHTCTSHADHTTAPTFVWQEQVVHQVPFEARVPEVLNVLLQRMMSWTVPMAVLTALCRQGGHSAGCCHPRMCLLQDAMCSCMVC